MKFFADTAPLIGLAKIQSITLLSRIASQVVVPPMVQKELLGKVGNESSEIDRALEDFIEVVKPESSEATVEKVVEPLDEGEKQVIMLAYPERANAIVLIDDRLGRQAAQQLGLKITGLVGLLIHCKEKGLIDEITPLLENLRNKGYWLSDKVVTTAVRLAGE